MEVYIDQRCLDRRRDTAIIKFSLFNEEHLDHFYLAQTINHSDQGICVKAEIPLKPGAPVLIKAENLHLDGVCNGDCRGLRSLTLAQVKWCKEISDECGSFYEIGAHYYPPVY